MPWGQGNCYGHLDQPKQIYVEGEDCQLSSSWYIEVLYGHVLQVAFKPSELRNER